MVLVYLSINIEVEMKEIIKEYLIQIQGRIEDLRDQVDELESVRNEVDNSAREIEEFIGGIWEAVDNEN